MLTDKDRERLEEAADLLQKHAMAGPAWEPVAFLRDLASRERSAESFIEIDADEFEEACEDPRVKHLLEQAVAYGRSLRARDHSVSSR